MKLFAGLLSVVLYAGPPSISELQPRGAQKGRPFTLVVAGQNLGDGVVVVSSPPATFTPMAPEKPGMADRYATFLVEPTKEWAVGVYPIRLRAANGISNVLLFSVGAFPELMEEESRTGAQPNQNDSIENAQSLPTTPLTLNGTLKGAERDIYRIQVKAGERRVFEVDARRCGSSIDPVVLVMDGSGQLIARSEDDPILSLDSRLDITFPRAGFYYIEVHDARFSKQAQNFYRLKTGAYSYASDIFPLGGRRGEQVDVSLSNTKVKADLSAVTTPQMFVNLPDSPSLPLPFAVGDYAELQEPVNGPILLPVTINGRLTKPAEVDKYELPVQAGDEFIIELQARELGTSKLTGLITVYDDKGSRLASAGDGPLPVDVAAVQASSRTLGDPSLQFKVPDGVTRIGITVEDLARRGGMHFAYRLKVQKAALDFQAEILTPYINIPAGGTAIVTVGVTRRGYVGPLRIEADGIPAGFTVSGGDIPAEAAADTLNRSATRRGILSLTSTADAKLSTETIRFRAVGKDERGNLIERTASGIAYSIPVNGASAQGVVDRQRPLTGAWLGYQLPTAMSDAATATLALELEKAEKKESGYQFRYRWTWHTNTSIERFPETVKVEVPNFQDLRVIEMMVDPKDKKTGTFLVTSTRNTLPALYNIGISSRLMIDGSSQDVYSPVLSLTVPALDPEENPVNATRSTAP